MLGNKGTRAQYRVGGTRGGRDQFKWDDVKDDKYRENYLGNSVNATVGRWQKGKDLTWYAKSKEEQNASLQEEKRRLRDLDDDLLNEALGIRSAPKKWTETSGLDADELKQLLARGAVDRGGAEDERVKGVGGAPTKFHDHIERKTYLEKEILRMKGLGGEDPVAKPLGGVVIVPTAETSAAGADGSSSSSEEEDDAHRRKKQKREKKEQKREKKDRKKRDKKERKEERRRHAEPL